MHRNDRLNDSREKIKNDLERTAEWRARLAAEFSRDSRNAEAETILWRLAATTDEINDSVIRNYATAFCANDVSNAVDTWDYVLRSIGFRFWPNTVDELVCEFVAQHRVDVARGRTEPPPRPQLVS